MCQKSAKVDKISYAFMCFFFTFSLSIPCAIIHLSSFILAIKLLHNLKTLSIADMGVIPYELLVPLGQLKALNLSGNHLVNVSMQILHPVDGLQVSKSGSGSSSSNKMLIHHFYFSGRLCSFLFSKSEFYSFHARAHAAIGYIAKPVKRHRR